MDGKLHMLGNTEHITSKYLTYGVENSGDIFIPEDTSSTGFQFKRLTLLNPQNQITSVFDLRKPIKVRLEYELSQPISNLEISLRVYNSTGIPIFTTNRSSCLPPNFMAGSYVSEIEIPKQFLSPDRYNISIGAHIPKVETLSILESLMVFDVEETGSNMALYQGGTCGVVLLECPWREINLVKT
jgi:lipopolysaccharide transport system ATP-binding protein